MNHQPMLDTHEFAKKLGFASGTLRMSRVTGILAGVPAPTYRKLGRKVAYDEAVGDEWLAQFPNQPNTAT
jgi:predicted DNA-binding transcriptional regulator AlpA